MAMKSKYAEKIGKILEKSQNFEKTDKFWKWWKSELNGEKSKKR